MTYTQHLGPVPQSEPLPGQVANSAGGYSFAVDDWVRLQRFLILGSEGGSYYATERKLTLENVGAVERCLAADGPRAVALIAEISDSGRAPKNDPAILALALALKRGTPATRAAAQAAVPKVCRIGTHLFHLAEYVNKLGGWGRGTRRAFANWYLNRPVASLAFQAIKYQQRDGWGHRDLLRLSHPKPAATDESRRTTLDWACRGWPVVGPDPHPVAELAPIWAFERAKLADRAELIRLIADYGLPHECVPNEAKEDPAVWEAMLPAMGITALIRNLAKMTATGLLAPMGSTASLIRKRLLDPEEIKRGRVHPFQILLAQRTYASSHGLRGKLTWQPVSTIVDALDQAFYLAFKSVDPTGKRHLLALDVSGSMASSTVAGTSISAREASAAMSLVTANVEPEHQMMAFSGGFIPLGISPRQRLDDVLRITGHLPFDNTDCALPMIYALRQNIPVDAFVIYTDSETWCGQIHPVAALRQYRQRTGIPAKLVVVGMVSNGFTIADPTDAGMLDVVGFDATAPTVMSDFIR